MNFAPGALAASGTVSPALVSLGHDVDASRLARTSPERSQQGVIPPVNSSVLFLHKSFFEEIN